jgi:hypothetical protein
MSHRILFASVALALTSAAAIAMAVGCSSSSSSGPAAQGGCEGGACQDSASTQDTGASGDTGGSSDAFTADGSHDGGAPDALYGACTLTGGFGWPCTESTSGADPTDCTDPNYGQCFVGGQGAWCTKTCAGPTDCTTGTEDAGCIPTTCNARGYCK